MTTVALVLAAGAGSRFGGGKLLATVGGRPILQHVLDRVAAAGIRDVVVVLGADAAAIEDAIAWRDERRRTNPAPERGLASSVRLGLDAAGDAARVVIVLGDQPTIPVEALRGVLDAPADPGRPIIVPRYRDDPGRNPVAIDLPAARDLVAQLDGDRGLGPVIAANPDRVRVIPIDGVTDNPDVDTPNDLVELLERTWRDRVRANSDQVERFREVPDGTDFYAPVTSLFRADPARTDEPALDVLLREVRSGESWLDIGAGAGRYALPVARALAATPDGGEVIAVDPSRGMLDGLREIAADHAITNVRVVEGRWPDPAVVEAAGMADVSLIAHVGYDIADIGPFVTAMEAATRRRCLAVLMERQPSSLADPCWPPVWGEERVALPALPDLVELLRAHGRDPRVVWVERAPRRFGSREELAGFLRRQLWVGEGTAAAARFEAALDALVEVGQDGTVGLRGQRPLPLGIVSWAPPATGRSSEPGRVVSSPA